MTALVSADRPEARPRKRLSRSGDFDRVYRDGSSRSNRDLVLYSFPRAEGAGEVRLGVTVGRKIGGAVQRNKVKRAIREAFWQLAESAPEGHDFVIVARPGVERLLEDDSAGDIGGSLAELLADAPERGV